MFVFSFSGNIVFSESIIYLEHRAEGTGAVFSTVAMVFLQSVEVKDVKRRCWMEELEGKS